MDIFFTFGLSTALCKADVSGISLVFPQNLPFTKKEGFVTAHVDGD